MTHVRSKTAAKKGFDMGWIVVPVAWALCALYVPFNHLGSENYLFWLFVAGAVLDIAGFITAFTSHRRLWVYWGGLMLIASWALLLFVLWLSSWDLVLIAAAIGTLYVSTFAAMALSVVRDND